MRIREKWSGQNHQRSGGFGAVWRTLIIVDFGTATTFCAVSSKGEYLGGVICPGIKISAEALFQKTAKLPKIDSCKT